MGGIIPLVSEKNGGVRHLRQFAKAHCHLSSRGEASQLSCSEKF